MISFYKCYVKNVMLLIYPPPVWSASTDKHLEVDTGYISKPYAKTKVKRKADLLQEISNKTAESGQTDKVSYYQLKKKFLLVH